MFRVDIRSEAGIKLTLLASRLPTLVNIYSINESIPNRGGYNSTNRCDMFCLNWQRIQLTQNLCLYTV